MTFTFKDEKQPIDLPWPETWKKRLKISGDHGSVLVALTFLHPKGVTIELSHALRREEVVQFSESLRAWLDSADSYPECSAPDCSDPCLSESDFCVKHQD